MKRGSLTIAMVFAGLVAGMVAFSVLSANGAFNTEIWMREHPLASPIKLARVHEGMIVLSDGRSFQPAGVRRRDDVSVEDYDNALRVILAQGVLVTRDLGDGKAFLLAEPKFYNWCGTRNYKGNRWARWAGSYLQCPLSELLIYAAYANPDLKQVGLTEHERWRLEGAEHISVVPDAPLSVSVEKTALRYDGGIRGFESYDATLELNWKPPSPP